ncbi:MAG: glycosyltransferase family 2 protein [Dorea sp.]|jgi:glycosyltransferase involved in cell wall biosynthesis|nr:glycosyltransferase family 2 protein [Dorea sp.]MCI9453609.1 glycosyltransferase family 2 protein [Dorea sp.]
MKPETVSLCVIAYNEETFLPKLFNDFIGQTYPHDKIEVVLVDGKSTDHTRQVMNQFAEKYADEFHGIRITVNEKRVQAAGWNVALMTSTSDVIIRIDAHTSIPPDFVTLNMRNLKEGEFVSGGVRPCIIENRRLWGKALLQTENSLFGSSISKSRNGIKKEYVKSMFHGAYRREVFAEVGGFNENLLRTEDNEIHYRIRSAGYNLCFDPSITSYQYARNTLRKMIKQKYGNGYWIGLTIGVCRECISLYHLVPAAFVLGIVITSYVWFIGTWQLAALMWGMYLAFGALSAVMAIKQEGFNPFFMAMPFLFLLLHLSYGMGTWIGILRMPFMKNKLSDCDMIDIVKESLRK